MKHEQWTDSGFPRALLTTLENPKFLQIPNLVKDRGQREKILRAKPLAEGLHLVSAQENVSLQTKYMFIRLTVHMFTLLASSIVLATQLETCSTAESEMNTVSYSL